MNNENTPLLKNENTDQLKQTQIGEMKYLFVIISCKEDIVTSL